jgi:hypothetical protein
MIYHQSSYAFFEEIVSGLLVAGNQSPLFLANLLHYQLLLVSQYLTLLKASYNYLWYKNCHSLHQL